LSVGQAIGATGVFGSGTSGPPAFTYRVLVEVGGVETASTVPPEK